jgi:ABC-type transport system involved in cytochrome bd biosynthesis fused ATPase/permease subunit
MIFLGYAYRFVSNFVFLALVYFALNFLDKYPQRAMVAILVLVYASMHAASALRSFYFFQRIERLEGEARRLAKVAAEAPSAAAAAGASRKQIVSEVSGLRHAGEMKAYIDLLFLALVILLCIAKIVTN